MKKFMILLIATVLIACATVPITGRKQLDLIPKSTMHNMSFKEYREFIRTHKLSTDTQKVQMVKRVGLKIQRAVERYMAERKLSHMIKGYQWEFNLVESDEINAWCMPGGKVVFYTGILPLTQNTRLNLKKMLDSRMLRARTCSCYGP